MPRSPRLVLVLTVGALAAFGASASALSVKETPVKGATYAGELLRSGRITVKVNRKGTEATVGLAVAPAFCQGGGVGSEPHVSKPAKISKQGALSDTITFYIGSTHGKELAKVLVKGNFFTFGSSTPVFQGSAKSTFAVTGDSSCDGQESFEAVK